MKKIAILFVVMIVLASSVYAGDTPLMTAVHNRDVDKVKDLLDNGANANEKGSPITIAIAFGYIEIVKLLLDKGANLNAVTSLGETPLFVAASARDPKIVSLLIERGAEVNAKDNRGKTPLFSANNGAIAKLLFDKGADVNVKGKKGETALSYAIMFGRYEVIEFLMEKGADPGASLTYCEQHFNDLSKTRTEDDILVKRAKNCVSFLKKTKEEQQQEIAQAKAKKVQTAKDIKGTISGIVPAIAFQSSTPQITSGATVRAEIDEIPITKAKPNKTAYAIVIGIEKYRQKLPKADFASSDAKLVAEYLSKVMGYPEENMIMLTDENATNVDIVKYVEEWLPKNFDKNGTLFIYYSGHGAPNPKTGDAFLVPYDGDPNFIEKTGYPLKRLYDNLSKLSAKEIIVVLDSCFSGAGGKSVLAEGSRPLVMNLQTAVTPSRNMIIMTASSGSEISSTYKEKGHGLFTYYLLKGMKGEADTNQDSAIEIEELYQYVKPQVQKIARRLYNNEQTPQLIAPEALFKNVLLQK